MKFLYRLAQWESPIDCLNESNDVIGFRERDSTIDSGDVEGKKVFR